jgi:hypothetical protein
VLDLARTARVVEVGKMLNELIDQPRGLFVKKEAAYPNALSPDHLPGNFMR